LRGFSAVFFMKQLDFLLLGLEQLTDTWNAFRHRDISGSFTIVAVIVDSGWEGPQSCLNHLADFTSLSRVPGFAISNRSDAQAVIDRHFLAPGVRIIGVSQRLFRTPIAESGEAKFFGQDFGVARYAEGDVATIVAFNLAFPQAMALHGEIAAMGRRASLFSVVATLPEDIEPIVADVERTKRMIVIDDGKSINSPSHQLVAAVRARTPHVRVIEVRRSWTKNAAAPNADQMEIDAAAIIGNLGLRL
jgi:pyruvate/2-oxoglutarate/acetoin dehydrogenase E1 component